VVVVSVLQDGEVILCEGGKRLEFDDPDALWEAIYLCTDTFLWEEVEQTKPKLIVPAGNIPKSVLLPDERKGIGACAGVRYDVEGVDYDIMPVHHPAHIIRNPKQHEQFWEEINEVRLYFEEKPGPFIVKTDPDLNDLLEIEKAGVPVGIDFETTSFHPWDTGTFEAFGKNYEYGDIICLSVCIDGIHSYVYTKEKFVEFLPDFKRVLEKLGVTCHNGQFDILFLNKYDIYPELKEDTMLASYATNEMPRHNLKELSRRHYGVEDWSEELEKYPEKSRSYAFIPSEVLMPYCGMDTALTKQLEITLNQKHDKDESRIYRHLVEWANMFRDINYIS